MIKEKITPELKVKFKESIRKTIETRLEHGFMLCKDDKGNLHPTDIYSGEETKIYLSKRPKCPPNTITQGGFHVHPDIATVRKFVFKDKHVPEKVIISHIKNVVKRSGVPITTPSQSDLANAIADKCNKHTEGSVCIGSDADPNRVDCWTVKNDIDCKKMEEILTEKEFKPGPPKKWIIPLFDKESIDLR